MWAPVARRVRERVGARQVQRRDEKDERGCRRWTKWMRGTGVMGAGAVFGAALLAGVCLGREGVGRSVQPVVCREMYGLGRAKACTAYDGPGEGEEEKTVVTYNCNGLGVHKVGRDATWGGGRVNIGKGIHTQEVSASTFFPPLAEGWDGGEVTHETGKATQIREYFREKRCLFMGLQETKHEDTAAAARYLTDGGGLGAWGTPGVRKEDGVGAKRMTAGVMLMWDEAAGVKCVARSVIVKHRAIKVTLELPDRTRVKVIVAYMDGAKATGKRARKAEEGRWEALEREVGGEGVVLMGDMNVTVEEKGWAGDRMRRLIDAGELQVRGRGEATHTRGTREIDHIMVSNEMAGVVGQATVDDMGDITRRDHRAVVVRWRMLQGEDQEGEKRVVGPALYKLRDEGWVKAGRRMEEALAATRRTGAGVEARDRLEAIQDMVMREAKAALQQQQKADEGRKGTAPAGVAKKGGRRTGDKNVGVGAGGARQGGMIGGKAASLRAKVRKWRELAKTAEGFDGNVGGGQDMRELWGLLDEGALRNIMIDDTLTEAERAEAVRAHVGAAHEEACEQLETCARAPANKFVEKIRAAVHKATGGGILVRVHEFLRHYTEMGVGGGGGAKLRSMRVGGGGTGVEVVKPVEVRDEAKRYGERQLGDAGYAWIGAVREAMRWAGGGQWDLWDEYACGMRDNGSSNEHDTNKAEQVQEAVDMYLTWEAFDKALSKAEAKKAVGTDGFSAYALRRAPYVVRRACWEEVREAVSQMKVPKAWKEWVAMLHMKPGEEADNLSRRRDIWLVANMQKVVQTCLKAEYERAGDAMVPGSASGFTALRNAPEQTVVARLAREHAANTRGEVYTAWIDYSQFFMSVVRSCQWETERFCGVHPGVTEIVRLLHDEVTGQYETAYGLTPRFGVNRGNGQGCVNGATRSKLSLMLTQRVVEKACKGYGFTLDPRRHICQCWFADDACLIASSLHELRKMMECCWIIARISGLKIMVKGKKKTAWAGTYWTKDGRGKDVEKDVECGEWRMLLPDGTEVPQIKMGVGEDVNYYKHLGSEVGPGFTGGQDRVRAKVVTRCVGIIGVIGGIKGLGVTAMNEAIESAVGGVVDYYGRACVLTWEDMNKIEAARAAAIQRATGIWMVPRRLLWAVAEEGGMGRKHMYARAAEALFDQFDRMLSGGAGEIGRAAVEAMVADTCYRLGCRGCTPLEWLPRHLEGVLSDESLVEAWLKIKIRTKRVAMQAGGQGMEDRGPLAVHLWTEEGEELRGPRLWEESEGVWADAEPCVYSRLLAGMGLIWWADIMDAEGMIENVKAMEVRTQKKWSAAERTEYGRVKGQLEAYIRGNVMMGEKWRRFCLGRAARGKRPVSNVRQEDAVQQLRQAEWVWDWEDIEGARRAPKSWGDWEYRVRWVGGGVSWVKGVDMRKDKETKEEMERARKRNRRPDGFHGVVEAKAGLQRACKGAAGGVSERDMRMLWAAFVTYVEEDRDDAGELPVCNLGAITGDEGRRSTVKWEVEAEQDMFYGGRELDPLRGTGGESKREAMQKLGGKDGSAWGRRGGVEEGSVEGGNRRAGEMSAVGSVNGSNGRMGGGGIKDPINRRDKVEGVRTGSEEKVGRREGEEVEEADDAAALEVELEMELEIMREGWKEEESEEAEVFEAELELEAGRVREGEIWEGGEMHRVGRGEQEHAEEQRGLGASDPSSREEARDSVEVRREPERRGTTWTEVLGESARPTRRDRTRWAGGGEGGGGGEDGRSKVQNRGMHRSRAGLEARWEGDEPRVMKAGAVQCALAYPELGGEGLVERALRGEIGASAKAICDMMWFEDNRGVWKYYTTEDDKYSMTEPNLWEGCHDAYLALMMRYEAFESGCKGIRMSDGIEVRMDKEEREIMKKAGTYQTGHFARRTVALHLRDRFTDVFATDGSMGGGRAAYGVWAGPARVVEGRGTDDEESEEEVEIRMRAGMVGGALPAGWGVTEAEMAAVIRALQIARDKDTGDGPGRRVLICTDSQATMKAMEAAWRKGRHTGEREDRKGLVATMVELRREISQQRDNGEERGFVRMVYTPGHRGIAPNAVADAIAKSYLGAGLDEDVIGELVRQAVHVRPYVYGMAGGEGRAWEGPDDRRANVQIRDGVMRWIRERYGGGEKGGGIAAGLEKGVAWGEVVRAVARGSDVALRRAKEEEGAQGHVVGGKEVAEVVARREGREAITFGMRTGEIEGVVHGERWRKYAKGGAWGDNRYVDGGASGCPAGCGVRCTLRHVIMRECKVCAVEDRKVRLAELQRAITEVDEAVIRPAWVKRRMGAGRERRGEGGVKGREVGGAFMTAAEREDARGAGWAGQVRAARRAISRAMMGKEVEEGDWEEVQRLMGGMVCQPAAALEWGERDRKLRVREIVEAIGEVQDWAWREVREWRGLTKELVHAYVKRDERMRAEEEQVRGWRVQRKKGKKKRVLVKQRGADWEAVASVNHARWVPPTGGEGGSWEYYITEWTGRTGWVADEIARRVIAEQPGAYGEIGDEMGLSARLDSLQQQHRALLESRGRLLKGAGNVREMAGAEGDREQRSARAVRAAHRQQRRESREGEEAEAARKGAAGGAGAAGRDAGDAGCAGGDMGCTRVQE